MQRAIGDAVSVRFFMPSPPLAPYITTYYLVEARLPYGGGMVEDWLHPEWGNLRISGGGQWQAAIGAAPLTDGPRMIASGPTSLCTHFTMGHGRCWGIGLLPAGWARFIDAPADAHSDSFCDAFSTKDFAALTGLAACVDANRPDAAAEAARFDAYLCDLLGQRPQSPAEQRIQQAHAMLMNKDVATVGEMSEQLAMSPRSLERLSLRAFGFAPKLLLRRQRFMRSLAQFMLDPSLAWIRTLDCHYVDQAHFVRDFKRFMTMSPSAYAALDHPVLRPAARARAAATGQAVQVLHRP
jgi:AraC-like DNA-binding protein